ncbi:MAG: hypothetical protein RIG77_16355 [Cyclobacteriaceae bacterium]
MVCKCQIKKNGATIKEVITDDTGSIDLTEYCGDDNITITYRPIDISYAGNTLNCDRANKTIPIYEAQTFATLEYNSFELLTQDSTARYKLIAAGARTELAEIARIHGMIQKSNELESSAIVLIMEALNIDKKIALYNDKDQENKTVLSTEGVALIKSKQEKLGTKADGVIGSKTISEAALIETNWLYTNKAWKATGINRAIVF